MQHADVAMYTAKGKRTGYELYEPGAAGADASRLQLAGDLRNAQPRRQLEMHYQPKVSLADGRVVGAEALMRWHHPEHGLMMPDQFIPLAERSGLIRSLTLFALDAAVREAARWFSAGIELAVSVNLSTRDLIDIQLPDEIERMLGTWRVPPSRLELEITESVLMADPERAAAVLEQLSRLGVKISIDDFGSGYSSLGYLKRLHVSDLKIDKSFVLNMTESEGDATIVKSTIDMAHNLGLGVVAEGVETQAVYDRLRTMGCDAAQGFLLSRPVSDDALLAWVRDRVGGTRAGRRLEALARDPEEARRPLSHLARDAGKEPRAKPRAIRAQHQQAGLVLAGQVEHGIHRLGAGDAQVLHLEAEAHHLGDEVLDLIAILVLLELGVAQRDRKRPEGPLDGVQHDQPRVGLERCLGRDPHGLGVERDRERGQHHDPDAGVARRCLDRRLDRGRPPDLHAS